MSADAGVMPLKSIRTTAGDASKRKNGKSIVLTAPLPIPGYEGIALSESLLQRVFQPLNIFRHFVAGDVVAKAGSNSEGHICDM